MALSSEAQASYHLGFYLSALAHTGQVLHVPWEAACQKSWSKTWRVNKKSKGQLFLSKETSSASSVHTSLALPQKCRPFISQLISERSKISPLDILLLWGELGLWWWWRDDDDDDDDFWQRFRKRRSLAAHSCSPRCNPLLVVYYPPCLHPHIMKAVLLLLQHNEISL